MLNISQVCKKIINFSFIKEIAELSQHLQNLEIEGFYSDTKSNRKTEFLSNYYKIVSKIMKNKFIKADKKILFEKIISHKLTENTVQALISNFTHKNHNLDSNAKVMLKAITQTKFEFFETFATNFKKAIFDLVTNPNEKSYLNKYVFKIIEKCLLKMNNVEKVIQLNI
jgi:hypothetical protein